MFQSASFLTIDATCTKDIDDALAIEQIQGGYRVLVAIADPTGAVPVGSPIDQKARRRAATVYVRDQATQRMLPSEVSEEACSLIAGQERPAFVFEIQLDDELQPLSFRPHACTITVAQRLSYRDIPAILATPEHPQHEQIKRASQLAHGLLARRRARGALALYDLQRMLLTDEEGNLRQFDSMEETIGHVVVQEAMVLANSLLAHYLAQENVPAIYRNHVANLAAPPQATLLESIESLALTGDLGLVQAKLQMVMRRARYEGVAAGHYGLNLPAYQHGTSPLRRYADLVNLHQLKAHLAGTALPFTQADVIEVAEQLNTTLDERREAVSASFKAAVERKAKAHMDAGQLQRLDEPQLNMAVKTARENELLPPALCAELVRRIKRDILPDAVANRLLFGIERKAIPDDVARAVSTWLFANPHKGMHFINFATQAGKLGDFSASAEPAGDKFKARAVATLLATGQECRGESIGTRKKDAGHLAACQVVAIAAAFPLPAGDASSAAKRAGGPQQRGAKQDIFEVCTQRRIAPPEFIVTSDGPPHQPTFVCTATLRVDGELISATSAPCASKKAAENDAAGRLMGSADWKRGADQSPAGTSPEAGTLEARDTGNPVGDVQEYLQRANHPLPAYEVTPLPGELPAFSCAVVVPVEGERCAFTARGSSKSEAKRGAARLALEALLERQVPPAPVF